MLIKRFLNSILCFTLSLSLFCLQIDLGNFQVGFNDSYAQSSEKRVVTEDGQLAVDKKQTIKGSKTSGSGMMNIIAMFALGALMAGMIVNCKPASMDVIRISIAGVAYIAGEVIAIKGFKAAEKSIHAEYRMRADGKQDKEKDSSAQIEALEAQLKLLKEEAKLAKTKRVLQTFAMTSLLSATAMSLMNAIHEKFLWAKVAPPLAACATTCKGVLTAVANTCPIIAKNSTATATAITTKQSLKMTPMPSDDHVKKDVDTSATITANVTAAVGAGSILPGLALGCKPPVLAGCKAAATPAKKLCEDAVKALTAAIAKEVKNGTSCNPVSNPIVKNMIYPVETTNANKFQKYVDSIIGKSQAFGFSGLGIGAGVIGAIAGMKTSLWNMIDKFMGTAIKRAAVYGVMTGIVKASLGSINEVLDANAKRQQQIRELIAKLRGQGSGGTLALNTAGAGQQQLIPDSVRKSAFKDTGVNIKLSEPLPCVIPSAKGKNCVSVAKGVKVSDVNFRNFGSSFASFGSDVTTVADGLSGSNTVSANVLAAARRANATAPTLERKVAQLKKKLQKELDKSPGNVSLNKLEKRAQSDFNKAIRKALPKDKAASLFASLAPTSTLSKEDLVDSTDKRDKKALSAITKKSKLKGSAIKKKSSTDFNFSLDDEDLIKEEDVVADSKTNEGLKDNEEYVVDDISDKKEASIFKIITSRYFNSGFSRIFEEEK